MIELNNIDIVWLLFCCCLLLFMQAGFVCLEAGRVRNKNSISVVMKNLVDLSVALLVFGTFGFGLMFYTDDIFSQYSHPLFAPDNYSVYVIFLVQSMFCATAVTIVSGAVAERMRFVVYVVLTICVACFIYPVVGSWVWGGTITGQEGWLAELGFYDFAGTSVVHILGGAIGLAATIIIGPRLGRFGDDGKPISSSSITLTCLGTILIMVGWLGFNGAGLLKFDNSIVVIVVNTVLGASAGILAGLILGLVYYKKAIVTPMINGALIGLVAVTGAANLMHPHHAIAIGFVAGLIPVPVCALLNKYHIDDPVGSIEVHLAGGVFGTLCTAFFITENHSSLLGALSVQALGVLVIFSFVFIASYLSLLGLKQFINLRVSPEDEIMGLNISEHNENASNADMVAQLSANMNRGDIMSQVRVDPQSDSYDVARQYNTVVSMFEKVTAENEKALEKAVYYANHDTLSGLLNRHASDRVVDKEYEKYQRYQTDCCLAIIDIDHFKSINDTYGHDVGDLAIKHIAQLLGRSIRNSDTLGRVGGEEFMIVLPNTSQTQAFATIDKIRHLCAQTSFSHHAQLIQMTLSAGVVAFEPSCTLAQIKKAADIALYEAKGAGRNIVIVGAVHDSK